MHAEHRRDEHERRLRMSVREALLLAASPLVFRFAPVVEPHDNFDETRVSALVNFWVSGCRGASRSVALTSGSHVQVE